MCGPVCILVGGEKLLKPALNLMSFYRLRSGTRTRSPVDVTWERAAAKVAPNNMENTVNMMYIVMRRIR